VTQGYETPRWDSDDDGPKVDKESSESQEGSTTDAREPDAAGDGPSEAADLRDPWELAAHATRSADADAVEADAETVPQPDDEPVVSGADASDVDAADVDRSSENVLAAWPTSGDPEPAGESSYGSEEAEPAAHRSVTDGWTPSPPAEGEDEPGVNEAVVDEPEGEPAVGADAEAAEVEAPPLPELGSTTAEHAPGELVVPPGVPLLEGVPRGERRAVGIVVGRFNGEVTTKLLEGAVNELTDRGVAPEAITVMPVPGAFELPLAAMALAKTRRFSCVVALGCVIRGDTPHFDYVSSEAASGLQLAAIETGVPVAFGVLTLDRVEQAEARLGKGAEAVRTGLEMADIFANLRAAAAR
jgi:6,7-dimethyl-8-ribityllumazine synthase